VSDQGGDIFRVHIGYDLPVERVEVHLLRVEVREEMGDIGFINEEDACYLVELEVSEYALVSIIPPVNTLPSLHVSRVLR
jgi:hypothetical protein